MPVTNAPKLDIEWHAVIQNQFLLNKIHQGFIRFVFHNEALEVCVRFVISLWY